MTSPTTGMLDRVHSRQYVETFVSVEKAGLLQDLSMNRFQTETAKDIRMGRLLGHISVNRRSTEIIKTATFEDDILAELEKDSTYDQDAVWNNVLDRQDTFTPSNTEPEPIPEPVRRLSTDDWTQLPLLVNQLVSAGGIDMDICERYRPSPAEIAAISENDDLLMAMDEDWMYELLNSQMGYDAFAGPSTATALQKSVAIQVWKIILESLAGFARRKSQMETTYKMRQLEAYGSPDQDMLVGLGLQCGSNHYDQFNTRPQLAT